MIDRHHTHYDKSEYPLYFLLLTVVLPELIVFLIEVIYSKRCSHDKGRRQKKTGLCGENSQVADPPPPPQFGNFPHIILFFF